MKKKLFSLIAAIAAATMLFAACESTPAPAEEGLKDGSYTAAAAGMNGDVNVEVVIAEGKISTVTVGEHSETLGTSDPAINNLPGEIVENQSIGLEVYAGATMTSNAILEAVADCITQAGGNPEDYKIPVVKEKIDAELETDVLVVGGGIAGLVAANEAADNGAAVILIEKMASVGGATALSGGEVLAAGTANQLAAGETDTWEALAEKWITAGEGHVNEEMLTMIAKMMPDAIAYLEENGVKFEITTPTAKPWDSPKRTHATGIGGTGLTDPLRDSAIEKGVEILLSSPATELIVEDGAVVGIIGTTPSGGKMTIRAKHIILATGGYDGNAELMAEYAPSVKNVTAHVGEGHNGDGLIWTRELGSPIIANDAAIVLTIIPYMSVVENEYDPYGVNLYVSSEGTRFMDESEYWFVRTREVYDLPGQMFYAIGDMQVASPESFDEAVANGLGFKADTIEELAVLIGADPAVLKATIDKYNEAATSGNDTEFGKAAEKMTPITEGPFYAITNMFTSISGSFGGPQIDGNCQVLGADGAPIENLYAIGELANGEIFYREYPSSGTSIATAIGMGKISARHALGLDIETGEASTATPSSTESSEEEEEESAASKAA